MKNQTNLWLGAVVCLVLLTGLSMGICEEDQMVRVSGALPLSDLVTGWANDYMKSNPTRRVAVMGKTAGFGYSQFLDGKANLVMATRQMTKPEQEKAVEKGLHVTDTLVMNIPVAVVTNQRNPLNAITLEQLRGIYAGTISNWKDVGGPNEPIKVLMRPYPATGVAVLFKQQLLKDVDFRKDAISLSSYKNMVHICEQSLAIGHMPATGAFCDPKKYQIKILALKKDANSPDILPGNADYPINMPFFFVWNADPGSPQVVDFVKYCVNKAKAAQRTQ